MNFLFCRWYLLFRNR